MNLFFLPQAAGVVLIFLLSPSVITLTPIDENQFVDEYTDSPSSSPWLKGPPVLQRVISVGTFVRLSCPLPDDPHPLVIDWLKDGQTLASTVKTSVPKPRFNITQYGSLEIQTVKTDDAGVYLCQAKYGFGRAEVNITLFVIDDFSTATLLETTLPSVTQGPETTETGSETVSESTSHVKPKLLQVTKSQYGTIQRPAGTSLRLRCLASGNPLPQLSWYKNEIPLLDIPQGHEDAVNWTIGSQAGEWSLFLQEVRKADSGNYTCVAKNPAGSVNATFEVEVVDPPTKKPEVAGSHPVNTTVDYGGSATFQCRVHSDAPPHIQWLKQVGQKEILEAEDTKEGIVRVQGELYRFLPSSEISSRPDGFFLNKLHIASAEEKDAGKYVCLGSNTQGYSYKSAYLTVLPKTHTFPVAWRQEHVTAAGQSQPALVAIPVTLGVLVAILVAAAILFHQRRAVLNSSHFTTNYNSPFPDRICDEKQQLAATDEDTSDDAGECGRHLDDVTIQEETSLTEKPPMETSHLCKNGGSQNGCGNCNYGATGNRWSEVVTNGKSIVTRVYPPSHDHDCDCCTLAVDRV